MARRGVFASHLFSGLRGTDGSRPDDVRRDGLFAGNLFIGMGDGEQDSTTTPQADAVVEKTSSAAILSEKMDAMNQGGASSPTYAPSSASASSSPEWLPYALVGGGVLVAGFLIMAATSGNKVSANRRRRRRRR